MVKHGALLYKWERGFGGDNFWFRVDEGLIRVCISWGLLAPERYFVEKVNRTDEVISRISESSGGVRKEANEIMAELGYDVSNSPQIMWAGS